MDKEKFKAGKKYQLEAIKILEVGYFELLNGNILEAKNKFLELSKIEEKLVVKSHLDWENTNQLRNLFNQPLDVVDKLKLKEYYFDVLKDFRGKILRFSCEQDWENLKTTSESTSRFCDVCSKSVYLVKNQDDYYNNYFNGNCVSLVNEELQRKQRVLNIPIIENEEESFFRTLGHVIPKSNNEDTL